MSEIAWFEGRNFVYRGGTLHYVNWDILDITQPELVILGMRSFAHNAAGETTTQEQRDALREEANTRYSGTSFIRLTQNFTRSNLLEDTAHNVAVLAQIFPNIAPQLNAYMDDVRESLGCIRETVQESETTALFIMV